MAEEAAEEGGGGGESSVIKKWGPLVAIILMAQVVSVIVLYQVLFKDSMPQQHPEDELLQSSAPVQQQDMDDDKEGLPYYLPIDGKITANPAGTNSERFVVLSIELGLVGTDEDGEKVPPAEFEATFVGSMAKVNQYMGRVKAIILEIVRAKTTKELESDSIPEVQKEIKRALNRQVFKHLFDPEEDKKKSVSVKEVIFTEIIIQ